MTLTLLYYAVLILSQQYKFKFYSAKALANTKPVTFVMTFTNYINDCDEFNFELIFVKL